MGSEPLGMGADVQAGVPMIDQPVYIAPQAIAPDRRDDFIARVQEGER